MVLPTPPTKEGRAISLGSLAVMERLGNPLTFTLLGIGDAQFTDSAEHLLELLYVHGVDDSTYYDIINNIDNPAAIKQQAMLWGSSLNINDITDKVRALMQASDMIQGSMVGAAKKQANASRKNG